MPQLSENDLNSLERRINNFYLRNIQLKMIQKLKMTAKKKHNSTDNSTYAKVAIQW